MKHIIIVFIVSSIINSVVSSSQIGRGLVGELLFAASNRRPGSSLGNGLDLVGERRSSESDIENEFPLVGRELARQVVQNGRLVAQQHTRLVEILHLALGQAQYSRRVDHSGEPMRNRQDRTVAELLANRLLNDLIGLVVDVGGCFVYD